MWSKTSDSAGSDQNGARPVGLNRFQGTRQASGEIGVLKCFFLYRTAEVGDGMPGKRRRSGSTPRRYRLFIGRAGSAARRALCYTANRIAAQQSRLLCSRLISRAATAFLSCKRAANPPGASAGRLVISIRTLRKPGARPKQSDSGPYLLQPARTESGQFEKSRY